MKKLFSATNENLMAHSLAPAMRRLIVTALDGTTITYGELKTYLEDTADFSTIFATRIGFVAGTMMDAIQAVDATAPLLNVLVVNQEDRMPSHGAGGYMAVRYGNARLHSSTYKDRHPHLWEKYFREAAAEVYAYSESEWAELYERVFGEPFSRAEIGFEREKRQVGREHDYGAGRGAGKYGTGGEGKFHKALRLWVTDNPSLVDRRYGRATRTETEFPLDSGDRVDAVYHLEDRVVVLEVKSRISNAVDLRRGVYQCIKYRAVKVAMDVREDVTVEAVLVTETKIPGDIAALLRQHNIRHRLVAQNRGRA